MNNQVVWICFSSEQVDIKKERPGKMLTITNVRETQAAFPTAYLMWTTISTQKNKNESSLQIKQEENGKWMRCKDMENMDSCALSLKYKWCSGLENNIMIFQATEERIILRSSNCTSGNMDSKSHFYNAPITKLLKTLFFWAEETKVSIPRQRNKIICVYNVTLFSSSEVIKSGI